MTLQKLRRWLGFPLEDDTACTLNRISYKVACAPGIFSALLILAFQAVMMVLSLLFCALQAIVFTTLVSIYLQEATE